MIPNTPKTRSSIGLERKSGKRSLVDKKENLSSGTEPAWHQTHAAIQFWHQPEQTPQLLRKLVSKMERVPIWTAAYPKCASRAATMT